MVPHLCRSGCPPPGQQAGAATVFSAGGMRMVGQAEMAVWVPCKAWALHRWPGWWLSPSDALCCLPMLPLIPAVGQIPTPRSPRVPGHGACRSRGHQAQGDGECRPESHSPHPAPAPCSAQMQWWQGHGRGLSSFCLALKMAFSSPAPRGLETTSPECGILCVRDCAGGKPQSARPSASLPALPRCCPDRGRSSRAVGAPRRRWHRAVCGHC